MPLMPATRPRNSMRITAAVPISAPPSSDSMGVKGVAGMDLDLYGAAPAARMAGHRILRPANGRIGRVLSSLQPCRRIIPFVLETERRLVLVHAQLEWYGARGRQEEAALLSFRHVQSRHLDRPVLAQLVLEAGGDVVLHDGWGEDIELDVAC